MAAARSATVLSMPVRVSVGVVLSVIWPLASMMTTPMLSSFVPVEVRGVPFTSAVPPVAAFTSSRVEWE